ncbi:hypothetical protein QVD99_004849 [Batrachochytrium dendrobatidis]|nr:hypothetical protein O5D80_003089 [Batrachochytrium dendrobatidis]KAK5669087.1 hypothetical protein QVD99_004849 [Batrachochytrium dendrobatidis]
MPLGFKLTSKKGKGKEQSTAEDSIETGIEPETTGITGIETEITGVETETAKIDQIKPQSDCNTPKLPLQPETNTLSTHQSNTKLTTSKLKRRHQQRSAKDHSPSATAVMTPSSMLREPGFDTDYEDSTIKDYRAHTQRPVDASYSKTINESDSCSASEDLYFENQDTVQDGQLTDGDDLNNEHLETSYDDENEETTVRDVQEAINISHPFGLKIWKPALYPKSRSIDYKSYEALHSVPGSVSSRFLYLSPDNLCWTLLFGWWIALIYVIVAIGILGPICLIGYLGYGICWVFGYRRPNANASIRHTQKPSIFLIFPRMFLELARLSDYALVLLNLADYMFWPFGKFIAKKKGYHMVFEQVVDNAATMDSNPIPHPAQEYVGIDINDPLQSSNHGARSVQADGSYYVNGHLEGGELQDLLTEFSLGVGRHDHYSWPSWVPCFVRRTWNAGFSGFTFYVVALLIIAPVHLIVSAICFFFIFPVPMARLTYVLLRHLLRHPLQLSSHYASEYQPGQNEFCQDTSNPASTDAQNTDEKLQQNTAANAVSFTSGLDGESSSAGTPLPVRNTARSYSRPRPKSVFFWRPVSTNETDPLPSSHFESNLESHESSAHGNIHAQNSNHPNTPAHATADIAPTRRTQRFYLPESNSIFSSMSSSIPLLDSEYEIVLCTYHSMGFAYYKYTVDGTNIIFINLLFMIAFTLFDFYVIGPSNGYTGIAGHGPIFVFALLSVIPLAYFIGMAVSSITAHTGSVAIGSVINATFGSIIEIILYIIALMEGKNQLVEGSIIGSFLAGLLALPGVAMFSGGLVRKEQRFNAKSAGVTSTMMVVAVIGVFTPTLFQTIYGSVQIYCSDCHVRGSNLAQTIVTMASDSTNSSCRQCSISKVPPSRDHVYLTSTKPLMYFCAIVLVLTYAVGLWFSLGTHASKIYPKKKPKTTPRITIPDGLVQMFSRRTSASGILSPRPLSIGPSQLPIDHSIGSPALPLQSSTHAMGGNTNANPLTASTLLQQRRPDSSSPNYSPATRAKLRRRALQDANLGSPNSRPHSVAGPTITQLLHASNLTTDLHHGISSPRQRVAALPHRPSGGRDDASSARSESDESDQEGGHDNPGWSSFKSALVLLACTVLYSIIAEVLIDSIDFVLETFPMDEKTLGLTIFAIVPTITEFYNAIAFAVNGNIVLSLEIGSAYAIQVALLQIPALVAFSAVWEWYGHSQSFVESVPSMISLNTMPSPIASASINSAVLSETKLPFRYVGKAIHAVFEMVMHLFNAAMGEPSLLKRSAMDTASLSGSLNSGHGEGAESQNFTLVFPNWDFYSVMFAMFLLTYIYIEGKSNYFKGAILLLSYSMLMAAFFFVPKGMDGLLFGI